MNGDSPRVLREPYFRRSENGLLPGSHARWPLDEGIIHGRLLAALVAWTVDRGDFRRGYRCARLTVDLLRTPRVGPVRIVTRVTRNGGRLRCIDVRLHAGERLVARASAALLRPGPQPNASPPRGPALLQHPGLLEPADPDVAQLLGVEIRAPANAGFTGSGARRVWIRERHELVEGEHWSDLARVAAAADLTNVLANSGTKPLAFINADVSIQVGRSLVGEWVGLAPLGHVSGDGIAGGACQVEDTAGPVGWSMVSAIATGDVVVPSAGGAT